jgi:hypothetical protein
LRLAGVSFVNRALAPRRPSATAAGFFFFAINAMLSAQLKKCKVPLDMLSDICTAAIAHCPNAH